jgi:hypothetical protein
MAAEFEVGDYKYRTKRMSAMTQFAVMRKFGPAMRKAHEDGRTTPLESFAELNDEDNDFVISRCMMNAERQDPKSEMWSGIWSEARKEPMFTDINGLHLLQICALVMEDVFADFSPAPRSPSADEPQEGQPST